MFTKSRTTRTRTNNQQKTESGRLIPDPLEGNFKEEITMKNLDEMFDEMIKSDTTDELLENAFNYIEALEKKIPAL